MDDVLSWLGSNWGSIAAVVAALLSAYGRATDKKKR